MHSHFYSIIHTSPFSDRVLNNIFLTGLFKGFLRSKLLALGFLSISLIGARGKKNIQLKYRTPIIYLLVGLLFYFDSQLVFLFRTVDIKTIAFIYTGFTWIGFMLILKGGSFFSHIIKNGLNPAIFNKENETFPQQEKLIKNEFSLNLPASYNLNSKIRNSLINFINARRGILVMGSPGSGKSYFLVENFINQIIEKGHSLFVFDQKFPELTTITYNHFCKHRNRYPPLTGFYYINFTHPDISHQCNPIHSATLSTLTSAIESSKSLLLSMNKTWVTKQGEFFVESPINLLAAVIWFLRKYEDGIYCSIPHAIELIHIEYEKLFTVLRTEMEIDTLINPFIQSYINGDMETLGSQMSSVKIPLGRFSSPEFYYILCGNDVSLDINNPQHPNILCLGNSPENQNALAPVMSLYIDRLNKIINQPCKYPCAQVCDEVATVRAASVMKTIATGRSTNITTIIAVQDYSQLKLMYSKEEAEVIFNITGNIISGQVSGETAKLLSDRFAKTFQDRQSISINSNDTSVSQSKQLELSVPPSTISSLSSGEFVGLIADNPDEVIAKRHSMQK